MADAARTIDTLELTKVFGRQVAVDHMSISVSAGEVFGFLGANGAGKTTAIRMLCGLLKPTSGGGHVGGLDIMTETHRIRSRIGYMPQRFSLYGDLTVMDNMRLYGGLYGLAGRTLRERIDGMVSLLDMGDIITAITGSLPWGWQQRLSLACANLHRPAVLFLDEPTGSVDPLSRRSFWDLIYALAGGGTTVFVTTHHMDEAEKCDRVTIMVDGKVVAVDTPRGLKQNAGCGTMQEAFVHIVEHHREEEP